MLICHMVHSNALRRVSGPVEGAGHTNLIVDHHDGDQGCVWPQGGLQLSHIDETLIVDRQVGDLVPSLL